MTEPTDAEIVELADATRTAEGGANGYILPISFARAVLAKWGTPPAVAGEPVAWRYVPSKVWGKFFYTEDPKRAQYARDNGIDVQPVFTTSHPTQAQPVACEPLTTSQIRDWWASENGLEDCEMCKLTDFTTVVRAVEEKHGITGGQHGAE